MKVFVSTKIDVITGTVYPECKAWLEEIIGIVERLREVMV